MLRLYNTLEKKIEEIKTHEPGLARMYTCGPTVYRHAHIGNLRSYLMADWIRRVLERQGLTVLHIKNITDVGHMRQEQLERGGDKVILAALDEGKTPQEIADFYTRAFHLSEAKLNILPATQFPRATDHVPAMLDVISRLIDRGYAYETGGNVYFQVSKYNAYGRLSGNTSGDVMEGVRSEVDPLKKDPRDFVLWKLAEPGRAMKWDSPWGQGFPGWHIECSAMSYQCLGEAQDIHTGGVDNIFPHHEDEIAQSEAAFGHRYVTYWVHGQHLLADGAKMSKSVGNEVTLSDLYARGFDPLAFRYLCLSVRYRHRLNFTFSALRAAEKALTRLRDRVWAWLDGGTPNDGTDPGDIDEWRGRFWDAINNDLNLPRALSVTWDMSRQRMSKKTKLDLILEFDAILGLGLSRVTAVKRPKSSLQDSLKTRESYRGQLAYEEADAIRSQLGREGYLVRDALDGPRSRPKTAFELQEEKWASVSSSKEVESLINTSPVEEFSIVITACNYLEDVQRCVGSVLKWRETMSTEIVVVDNGSTDGTGEWLEELQTSAVKVRVLHCDHQLGDAQAKNIGLKQSKGRIVVMMDTSTELTDDPFQRIKDRLDSRSIGVVGPWGLRSDDLHHFHEEVLSGDADAMQAYCFAFRRDLLIEVGLMRENFRFYRNLDLDFSFQFRDCGYRIVADGTLPVERHEHRQWTALGEEDKEQLSRRNFKYFFRRWGKRRDLLVGGISE